MFLQKRTLLNSMMPLHIFYHPLFLKITKLRLQLYHLSRSRWRQLWKYVTFCYQQLIIPLYLIIHQLLLHIQCIMMPIRQRTLYRKITTIILGSLLIIKSSHLKCLRLRHRHFHWHSITQINRYICPYFFIYPLIFIINQRSITSMSSSTLSLNSHFLQ